MSSPGITDLLDKADRSLAAAERLLADGFHDFAAGRSYS
ncbi:MAG: HEPN domain-containing protein [Firmicutes bacterium]|nr:HEPN domain-containing protein [Bacillota bacterium]